MCSDLDVSVGKQQVHDDVLGQNFGVVDAEFDAGEFFGQFFSLIFFSGFSDVIEQSVLKGGAAGDRRNHRLNYCRDGESAACAWTLTRT